MSSVQVYTVSQLAEQTTPLATLLSDSLGLVENMSFMDLDQMAGWEMPEKTDMFRREKNMENPMEIPHIQMEQHVALSCL